MPIIGKLLKKTTEISYLRNARKGIEYRHQIESLRLLLETAKNTKFGLYHSFHKFVTKPDMVSYFQENVPISNYEDFYEKWLKETIAGAKDHTWRGKIKYYALSSGTTGSPSKRIPVTLEMIRSFQRTSMRQLAILHELHLSEKFYSASVLTVGGSTKLVKKGKHIEGDLSGILKKHTSLIVTPFTKPGNRITAIKDWNEKLNMIIERAPKWNIGIIAGIPSWCILLMERIVEHYKLQNIHEIWPNLEVYVHGGVFMEPYIERLEKISGKKINLLDTYLASEGYFAYQTSLQAKGMKLLLNNGIFFEFVPFNSDYFDENGELIDNHEAFTISQVKEGVDYAILITTNAGLWRYLIGDLVQFTNLETYEIKITGRIKQFLSLCGEHLSLDNINQALLSISKKLKIGISEYTIYADSKNSQHNWFIGCQSSVDEQLFAELMDKKLSELNDDYAYVRKYNLDAPKFTFLPAQKFYDFLESQDKMGAQNKMPRVLNKVQAEKWLNFLNETASI
jgi:phenylacetate-coenzyme A ligase PaaK-like adenylate-forming protein